MLLVASVACWFDPTAYEKRREELTDHDGDGFAQEDDCDDESAAVFPGAKETCDGVDQDCNGEADDAAVDALPWWLDADADGYAAQGEAASACAAPAGMVGTEGDCDDGDSGVHPGGTETAYDGVDQDCDGADLVDVDADGEAAAAVGGGDCNDADPAVYPEAEETWGNGVTDNDCDGEREAEQLPFGSSAWIGEDARDEAGRRGAAVGDGDGDGLAEFLVGAPYQGNSFANGGAVYLVPGGDSSGDLGSAHVLVPGGEDWFLPQIVEGGPDVDGDGTADFLASAPGYSARAGAVFLVSGGEFGASSALALPKGAIGLIEGDSVGDLAGAGAGFLGDVMGDGGEYVAISAVYADPASGADAGVLSILPAVPGDARVADGNIVNGPYADALLGNYVDSTGDQDGDGVDDFVVSVAYGDLAYVVPGGVPSPALPDDALFRLTGTGAGETGGIWVLGDTDADGTRDLGCIVDDNQVRIFTALAADPVRTVVDQDATIELGDGALGYHLLDLGDLDGDGRAETLVPVQWEPTLATSVLAIVFGEDLGFRADYAVSDAALTAVSLRPDGRFGYRTAISEDLDGDGGRDLVVGGYSDAQGGTDAGAVVTVPLPR